VSERKAVSSFRLRQDVEFVEDLLIAAHSRSFAMKLSFFPFLVPVLVVAHDVHHAARHNALAARQAVTSAPAAGNVATTSHSSSTAPPAVASSSTTVATQSSAATTAPVAAVTTTSAATTPTVTYTFSLEATNPTAIPLSLIVSGAPSQATVPLDSTYSPGAVPTGIPGAPPLPNAALLNPANYPALDIPPPTDTPEVLQWIQDVANSGVVIPDIAPNLPGGCPANLPAADNSSNCWWTCGGCTRPADITTCPKKDTWGLTYDDGPAYYTPNLLQFLDSVGLKSTFFVVGSRAISFPETLQSEFMGQHQIAVHTWSHPSLTTLSNEEIIAELGWSKKIIKDVTGLTPNMMRPPYGDIDDRVRAIAMAMGLTPVIWTRISPMATFDTGDFNIAGGTVTVGQVLENWEQIIGNASQISTGFIVLEHDLFQQSVDVATGYILPDAIAHHFNIEPVISCLNLPLSDAYIETNNNQTNPPAISAATLSAGAPGSTSTGGSSQSGAIHMDATGLFSTLAGVVAGVGAVLL
jgi:peptidoglycan/xylan/chitin deacetylase (PgdA/CDA1 family)